MNGSENRLSWQGVGSRPLSWLGLGDAAAASAAGATRTGAARNNFDGLRLAAALLVVYGHQMPDQTGTFGLRLLIFFSISGFLIAGSWKADPHAGRFMVRRFLRVWPAYAAVIVTCAALSFAFPARDMPGISRLGSMFYLSNLWFSGFDWGFFQARNPLMNQSIWMMRYEVDLYIAFVVLGAVGVLLQRKVLPVVAVLVLGFALGSAETHPEPGGLLECWSLFFAGFFSFGILLREYPALRATVPVAASVALGAMLLGVGERTAGLMFVIPPAAVWLGERSWPVIRSASRFGDLSLGIFLWAWPAHQFTQLWLAASVPGGLRFAIVLAQVVTLAWLSWRFIEAPALRRKPLVPGKKRPAQTEFLVTA